MTNLKKFFTLVAASGGYDIDALDYFTRVEAAGGTISASNKTAYNNFVLTHKALNNSLSGLSEWESYKEIWVPIHNTHASLLAPALVKAKYPAGKLASLTNSNFVFGDYTLANSLQGNNTSKLLTTDMTPNDLSHSDYHNTLSYNQASPATTTGGLPTLLSAGNNAGFDVRWIQGTLGMTQTSNSISMTMDASAGNSGVMIYNAIAANNYRSYFRGLNVITNTSAHSAFSNANAITVYGTNNPFYWFNGNVWHYSFGTKFDTANIPVINTAWKTLLTALGRGYTEILWEGDSITLGTGTTTGTFPSRTQKQMNLKSANINIGVGGQGLATMLANASTKYPSRLDSASCFHILGGINDLRVGVSAVTCWTSLSAIITYVQSLGVTKIFVGTVIDGSTLTAPQETERATFNTTIRNNAVGMNYTVVDYDASTSLGTWSATDFADSLHPNDTGAQKMAVLASTIISPFI